MTRCVRSAQHWSPFRSPARASRKTLSSRSSAPPSGGSRLRAGVKTNPGPRRGAAAPPFLGDRGEKSSLPTALDSSATRRRGCRRSDRDPEEDARLLVSEAIASATSVVPSTWIADAVFAAEVQRSRWLAGEYGSRRRRLRGGRGRAVHAPGPSGSRSGRGGGADEPHDVVAAAGEKRHERPADQSARSVMAMRSVSGPSPAPSLARAGVMNGPFAGNGRRDGAHCH